MFKHYLILTIRSIGGFGTFSCLAIIIGLSVVSRETSLPAPLADGMRNSYYYATAVIPTLSASLIVPRWSSFVRTLAGYRLYARTILILFWSISGIGNALIILSLKKSVDISWTFFVVSSLILTSLALFLTCLLDRIGLVISALVGGGWLLFAGTLANFMGFDASPILTQPELSPGGRQSALYSQYISFGMGLAFAIGASIAFYFKWAENTE